MIELRYSKFNKARVMSTIWKLNTRSPHYEHLRDGIKTYEGRVPDPDNSVKHYHKCQVDDIIEIYKDDSETGARVHDAPVLKFRIVAIKSFNNLDKAFEEFDFKLLDPHIESVEEEKRHILSFPGYAERIKNNGFYIFKLERI